MAIIPQVHTSHYWAMTPCFGLFIIEESTNLSSRCHCFYSCSCCVMILSLKSRGSLFHGRLHACLLSCFTLLFCSRLFFLMMIICRISCLVQVCVCLRVFALHSVVSVLVSILLVSPHLFRHQFISSFLRSCHHHDDHSLDSHSQAHSLSSSTDFCSDISLSLSLSFTHLVSCTLISLITYSSTNFCWKKIQMRSVTSVKEFDVISRIIEDVSTTEMSSTITLNIKASIIYSWHWHHDNNHTHWYKMGHHW